MKTGTLAAAGALVVAMAAGAVWAQAPRLREAVHGSFGPFRMLAAHHAFHELGLTEAQKTQIKGVLRAHREEFRASVDRLRGIHEAVRKLGDQETIDEAAIRETVGEATGPLGDLAVLHARVHREIAAVLTPEQQQKAEALQEGFRSHMKGLHKHFRELGDDLLEDPS